MVSRNPVLARRAALAVAALAASSVALAPSLAFAQNAAVTVNVDVAAGRRPISPLVYGVNFAGANLADLNCPVHRTGGNHMTRYNWQQNADNKGSDWFFQSIADADPTPGERLGTFVAQSKAAGSKSMVTIPTMGWVAKVNADRSKRWSFSVGKYGAQQSTDWQWAPDAGNGVRQDGNQIGGNDPNDASVPTTPEFMRPLVSSLFTRFGATASGGVDYYIMDNEPSIWHATHRDVHPGGATMKEVWDKLRATAQVVKSVDPTAQVVGPEEWGWSGYFYSGHDQQWGPKNGWWPLPDRTANGGQDYMPWLLQQAKAHHDATGQRLLDVFSLHYYPQGGEFSDNTSVETQLRRNRSTRSLWDPAYRDESWIGDTVRLVPRMKDWVSQNYPGTKIALTEYSWGADGHISGATAQADVLGILGREGMDIATRWVSPDPSTPTYKAIKMYRNYDGNKGTFGDTSVAAAVPNPDVVSAFASQDSASGAVKVMVISKALSGTTPVTVAVANHAPGAAAQVYQLTSSNAINRLADVPVSGQNVSLSVPPQSVTLLVLPKGSAPQPAPIPALGVTAPSNLTLPATSATSLRPTWRDNSSDESGFSVEISRDGGATWTMVGTAPANATSFDVTGLTRNMPYACRVRAFRNGAPTAHSAYSNTASGRTPKR